MATATAPQDAAPIVRIQLLLGRAGGDCYRWMTLLGLFSRGLVRPIVCSQKKAQSNRHANSNGEHVLLLSR